MDTPIRVGEFEVLAISDGRLVSNPTTSFPTSDPLEWDRQRICYPQAFTDDGDWNNNLGLFWLRTPEKVIVVDTGIGPGPVPALGGAGGALPAELDRLEIDPTSVDIVFFTHLHPDHIGWTFGDRKGSDPLFANARHLVHRADWDHFARPASTEPSQAVVDCVLPLEDGGQLELLDGDRKLSGGVDVFHTPGHTPGHMSLLASSVGEELFVSGDLIHHPTQVDRTEWFHRADLDSGESYEHRRTWLDRVEERGTLWATGHFPPPPSIGTLARTDDRRVWRPIG